MNNVIFSSEKQSGKQNGKKHVSSYFPFRFEQNGKQHKSRYFPTAKQNGKKHYINIHLFPSALLHTVTGTPKDGASLRRRLQVPSQ